MITITRFEYCLTLMNEEFVPWIFTPWITHGPEHFMFTGHLNSLVLLLFLASLRQPFTIKGVCDIICPYLPFTMTGHCVWYNLSKRSSIVLYCPFPLPAHPFRLFLLLDFSSNALSFLRVAYRSMARDNLQKHGQFISGYTTEENVPSSPVIISLLDPHSMVGLIYLCCL